MSIEHTPYGRIGTSAFCAYSGTHGEEACENEATIIIGCGQAQGITFILMACTEHAEAVRTFLQRMDQHMNRARLN